jgi:hypothetical protein
MKCVSSASLRSSSLGTPSASSPAPSRSTSRASRSGAIAEDFVLGPGDRYSPDLTSSVEVQEDGAQDGTSGTSRRCPRPTRTVARRNGPVTNLSPATPPCVLGLPDATIVALNRPPQPRPPPREVAMYPGSAIRSSISDLAAGYGVTGAS